METKLLLSVSWPAADSYPLVDFVDLDRLLWVRPQADGRFLILEVQVSTGQITPWPDLYHQEPFRIARSPDGQRFALTLEERIHIIPRGAHEPTQVLLGYPPGARIWGLEWATDRHLYTQATKGPMYLWDVDTQSVLAQADPYEKRGWSMVNGRWLLLSRPSVQGRAWSVSLHDGLSGALVRESHHTLAEGAEFVLSSERLRPGTSELATILTVAIGDEAISTVRLFTEGGVRVLGEIRRPKDDVSAPATELEFVGTDILVVGGRTYKGFWNLNTGQQGYCPAICSSSPSGRVLSADGLILDLHTGARIQLRPGLNDLCSGDRCTNLSPDGRLLAVSLGDTLEVYALDEALGAHHT